MWRIAWGLMQATKAIGAPRFLRPREHRQKAGDGHGAKSTYKFPTPHTHPPKRIGSDHYLEDQK
jgi:hypothetical protein